MSSCNIADFGAERTRNQKYTYDPAERPVNAEQVHNTKEEKKNTDRGSNVRTIEGAHRVM